MFSIQGNTGELLSIDVTLLLGFNGNGYVRLFDSAGTELAADAFSGPNSNPRLSSFSLPADDTYTIGVSGWSNTVYDPNVANSGTDGGTGNYELMVKRSDEGGTSLSPAVSTASGGTAARGGVDWPTQGRPSRWSAVVFARVNLSSLPPPMATEPSVPRR